MGKAVKNEPIPLVIHVRERIRDRLCGGSIRHCFLEVWTVTDEIILDEIHDASGAIRRMGSLTKPANFVSAFPTFESVHPVYDDADIRKAITDPDRVVSRKFFGTDWVQDQKSHGSCNGFALANALGRARVRRGLAKLLLSGAYAYSKMNGGRDNGSALEDGLKVVQQWGCCPASLVPWNQIYPSQQPSNANAEAAKHKGLVAFAVETRQGLRSALAAGFPCIVAVHVGSRFSTLRNGICGVDGGPGNHAVCVDDLRIVNGNEVFDMENSWSTSFGEQGRGYLLWDHFSGTFNNHVFFAVASTEDSE